jgi:glycosyltransferase involved in cell wall biosynthesis
MKVAEYVFLGLPVICSGIATMRYYFSDDELLFFEPENADDLARAIRALLADPAAAKERAARSRMKLDKFDWPAQEETLVKTVEAPTGSRKPHSWGKAGLADQVRRMRTTEQKDKEITKHA